MGQALLVDRSPQVILLAFYPDKDFIDEERIAVASMVTLEPLGAQRPAFDAPETDRLAADSNAALCQKIFSISVAQVEAVVEPDCVGNDVRWESVAFVGIHPPILSLQGS